MNDTEVLTLVSGVGRDEPPAEIVKADLPADVVAELDEEFDYDTRQYRQLAVKRGAQPPTDEPGWEFDAFESSTDESRLYWCWYRYA